MLNVEVWFQYAYFVSMLFVKSEANLVTFLKWYKRLDKNDVFRPVINKTCSQGADRVEA